MFTKTHQISRRVCALVISARGPNLDVNLVLQQLVVNDPVARDQYTAKEAHDAVHNAHEAKAKKVLIIYIIGLK